jgi:hypothetical protein
LSKKIQEIYDGVMGIIRDAEVLLDDVSVPDTDKIKSEVARLCAAINALPVEKRVAYADQLGGLFDALSELEVHLKQKRKLVGDMLGETSTHKSASKAYAKIEQIDFKTRNKKEDK